ncbi:MAG: phospho-sugar mutase [Lachnospiraceae bacterium]|nr:phospho-sugar mutase [Lachnospiraceae bacterium]MBQ7507247.1 phospho-sugar mutase [Lachnospiraceae bacterium]
MGYRETYEAWLADPYFDAETKKELEGIAGDEKEIEDRFYRDLEFGTAGLRGVIGAGTNRMNFYTVRKATQGLANYIKKQHMEEKGVAISYDSRHFSPEFADSAALCLAANGIKAYVFTSLRPTPELSFAVRYLKCAAGINITASHNPSEYNGYKVYWEDGAQITPPHDKGIMEEVRNVTDWANVLTMELDEAKEKGLYQAIAEDVDGPYMEEIKKLVLRQDCIDSHGKDITIVYTPLHGTGNIPVRRVLKEIGFEKVFVVPEQELPDGDFPTVGYPNPETEKAFELGVALGKEKDADLILATDPDADRLGVYVKDAKTGEYHPLTGNMSGCLIGEYIISQKKEKGTLPSDGAFIRSIVSTTMADAIAKAYGIELIEVLTGFKYIGQKILEFEESGKGSYVFGMEESYGCLPGTYARDKDAVAASMFLCEAAAYYKTRNMTLWDAMLEMYEKYGFYTEHVESVTLKGIDGLKEIQNTMKRLRDNAPKTMGDYSVNRIRDYASGKIRDLSTGEESGTGLPESNVLYYELNDNAWVCVRPSGTEPKIKFYIGVRGTGFEDGEKKAKALLEEIRKVAGV